MMSTNRKQTPRSIIWTINPYESKFAHREPLAKFLKVLSRGLSQKVMPFSVVSLGSPNWTIPNDGPMGPELVESGTRAVAEDLKRLHMNKVASPTVEFRKKTSRSDLVDDVIRFSKEQNADFIAVNTRRLLSPFPFKIGGFAEALVGKSKLPIIAVSPKAKISKQVKSILFATDFSPRSHKAFKKTLKLASKLRAKICLLHLEIRPTPPFAFTDVPIAINEGWIANTEKVQLEQSRKIASRWCTEALKSGVRCNYESVHAPTSVASAILRGAKRNKVDLISLASYRRPKTPTVIGGTVRDVLSAARTPVLEIHSG
jgi:nucleotide-binding universal stress UspA family protein